MPRAAKTPCRHPGCRALVDKPGFCPAHQRQTYRAQKQTAGDAYQERNRFYQRATWKRLRQQHLSLEPLCRECRKAGRLVAGEVVDHIHPFQSPADPLALDAGNLQTLCKPCHNAKTRSDTNRRRGP
jgi:5-methylcytosine-specific restriction protein A